jgi:hypothetical protein
MTLLFAPDFTVDEPLHTAFTTRLSALRVAAAAAARAPPPPPAPPAAAAETAAEAPPAVDSDDDRAAAARAAEAPVVPNEANAVWPMLLWTGA